MKRTLSILFAFTLVVFMFTGCAGNNGGQATPTPAAPVATQSAAPGNTPTPESAPPATEDDNQLEYLTIAISADENSMTPITYVSGSPGFDIMKLMYDSLFAVSAENTVIPWMIEDDYDISDDFKTFKMTLLDGQMWHDGTPLTAEDVVFTFDYYKNTYVHGRWTPIATKTESVTASGNEITIVLAAPDPGFLRAGLADIRIISKNAYENAESAEAVPNMGSGAYKLVEYKTGEYYTLEAMDNYFRGTPRVKTIRMPIIKDANVAQQALIAGEIAASTRNISPELIENFSNTSGITVESSEGYASLLLLMDNEKAPFDDPEFRRAVSYAIDIDTIINQVYLGYAERGTAGYVRKGLDEHTAGLDYVFDINKGNELLDSLGYTEKGADGMRLRLNGEDMTLVLLTSASNPQRMRSAEIIAQQLAAIGLHVEVQSPDGSGDLVWPEMDTSLDRSYDMSMFGWSAPVIQRAGTIIGACSSDYANTGGQNLPHYVSEEFDALASEFLQSTDAAERANLNEEMQRVVADDTPFITLLFADTICAVNYDMYDGWVFAKGTNAVNLYSFLN